MSWSNPPSPRCSQNLILFQDFILKVQPLFLLNFILNPFSDDLCIRSDRICFYFAFGSSFCFKIKSVSYGNNIFSRCLYMPPLWKCCGSWYMSLFSNGLSSPAEWCIVCCNVAIIFDYCSFVIKFETRQCDARSFAVRSKSIWLCNVFYCSMQNLWFSYFLEQPYWNLY